VALKGRGRAPFASAGLCGYICRMNSAVALLAATLAGLLLLARLLLLRLARTD
jgi:hypothetical protein